MGSAFAAIMQVLVRLLILARTRLKCPQRVVSKEVIWELSDFFFVFLDDLRRRAHVVDFQVGQAQKIMHVREVRVEFEGLLEFTNRIFLVAGIAVGAAKHEMPDRSIAIVLQHLLEDGLRLLLLLEVEQILGQQQLGIRVAMQLQRASHGVGRAAVILFGHQELSLDCAKPGRSSDRRPIPC